MWRVWPPFWPGLPWSVPGETVNRLCASGMSAAIHAHRAIMAGDGDLFIAGGVENMSRGPYVISKSESAFDTGSKMYDSFFRMALCESKNEGTLRYPRHG